jgi:hypothetical protein
MKAVAYSARSTFATPVRRVVQNANRQTIRTTALFGGSKSVPSSIYDIKIKTIDGKDASMSQFKGKVR